MCQYMTITSFHIQLQAKFTREQGNISLKKDPYKIIFMWYSHRRQVKEILTNSSLEHKISFGTPNYEFINKCISHTANIPQLTAHASQDASPVLLRIRIGGGLIPEQLELSSLWQQGDLRRRKSIIWLDIKTDKLKPAGPPEQRCWCRALTSRSPSSSTFWMSW